LLADVWLDTGRNNLWKISARGTVKLRLLHNNQTLLGKNWRKTELKPELVSPTIFVTIKGLNEVNWIETYPNKEFTKNIYPRLDFSEEREGVTESMFSVSPPTRNEPICVLGLCEILA